MRLSVVALAVLVACGGSKPPPAKPPKPDPAAQRVHAALEPLYAEGILAGGMVIGLVEPTREGGVGWLGLGRTSPEVEAAPGPDAVFEIGSVSKVLTSLLLVDAVARGEVTLDTPVIQLLPFGVRFPDKDGVLPTLGHLASHRSGLPSLPDNLSPATLDDPYATYGEQQLFAYLERAELMFTPGTAYAYSNLGAGILGHLLARKLGAPYAQAVRARILEPLGLGATSIDAAPLPGTTASGQPAKPWTFDVLAGAGAWRSTPRDMARLVITSAAAVAGRDVPLAETLRRTATPVGDAGPDMEIALGWHVNADGVVWHNGMTGGHSSFIGFDPRTEKGVVVLASTASPLVTRIGMGLFDVLAGKDLDLGLDFVRVPEAELDRLVGTYRLQDGTELAVERHGARLDLTMGPERIRLFPRSPTRFVIIEIEATLEFVIEGDVVRGFVLTTRDGQIPAERVP